MFFIFEQVPIPPILDFQSHQIKNPANSARLSEITTRRSQLVNIIVQLTKDQSVHEIDFAKVDSGLSASIDLVI